MGLTYETRRYDCPPDGSLWVRSVIRAPAPLDSARQREGRAPHTTAQEEASRVTARGESPLTTTTNPNTVNKEHADASRTPDHRFPHRIAGRDCHDRGADHRLVGTSAGDLCESGGADTRVPSVGLRPTSVADSKRAADRI